jgi:hypothetical protein
VRSEPRIQLQQILGVKIDKALDNNEQSLTPVLVSNIADTPIEELQVVRMRVKRQMMLAQPAMRRPYPVNGGQLGNQTVPVRIQRGEKESKTIKELRGVVSIKIRTPVDELVTVENILMAKGEAVKGKGDAVMKILGVEQEDNGDIKVEVEIQFSNEIQPQLANMPGQPLPGPAAALRGNIQIQIQIAPAQAIPLPANGPAAPAPMIYNQLGIEMLDSKGGPLTLIQMQLTKNQWLGNGRAATATATFRPLKDQEVAKLVFKGTRIAAVDVPFSLRDVPVK